MEASIAEFVLKMEQLVVPTQWRKVDVIQEAKSLQVKILMLGRIGPAMASGFKDF